MKMKDRKTKIEIYDTTLRDGTQTYGVSLSLEDKLQVAQVLKELGVDYIEGGYPLSNPKDAAFFREAARLKLGRTKLVAFGMTRRKNTPARRDEGLKALLDSGTPTVTIVGKSWDMHVRDVLRTSRKENLSMIADSISLLVKAGREVLFDAEHFFDGYCSNEKYAMETLRVARDAGASCLVLCDTNGGATMGDISRTVKYVYEEMGGVKIGIHCHNDCGLGVANTIMAVRHGARHVQGTINGMGERCGNADLVAIIGNLAIKYDYDVLRGGSLERLAETSRYVYEAANLNFRDDQPFVGASAFAHKGGMHVHAVRRKTATYEHISPEIVGNTRRILVSELSGMSNIAAVAPKRFALAKDKPAQRKILRRLMELESEGYQFEAAEGSFDVLIRKTLGGKWYRKLWDLDHYRCVIFKHSDAGQADTEAIVKLRVNGDVKHTVSAGHGPVDSLHAAICAALRDHYPHVDDLHLMDYKVRVVNTAAETAATVRVVIDWHDSGTCGLFGTVGVNENIIDASWRAIVDAIQCKLLSDLDDVSA